MSVNLTAKSYVCNSISSDGIFTCKTSKKVLLVDFHLIDKSGNKSAVYKNYCKHCQMFEKLFVGYKKRTGEPLTRLKAGASLNYFFQLVASSNLFFMWAFQLTCFDFFKILKIRQDNS